MATGSILQLKDVNMKTTHIEENIIYITDTECPDCPNKVVMSTDVSLYEETCGAKVMENGGNILEIGFGLGISADKIQELNPTKHIIIEKDPKIYIKATQWAATKENVDIIQGDWFDEIHRINEMFDGIYHDADDDTDDRLSNFTEFVKKNANEGCLLIMTNWGNVYLKSTLPYITLDQDAKGQEVFKESQTKIAYATYQNNDWS